MVSLSWSERAEAGKAMAALLGPYPVHSPHISWPNYIGWHPYLLLAIPSPTWYSRYSPSHLLLPSTDVRLRDGMPQPGYNFSALATYLDRPDVRRALHVDQRAARWQPGYPPLTGARTGKMRPLFHTRLRCLQLAPLTNVRTIHETPQLGRRRVASGDGRAGECGEAVW